MNLEQIIRAIESAAGAQPVVATIVRNDIFRLNAVPDVTYGVFAWLQGEHRSAVDDPVISWSFTFFYADRLTADRSNEIAVQSTGIDALENVLRTLADAGIVASDYSFRTFNERFSDECAGAFCNVVLQAPKYGICPEPFEHGNPIII